VRLRKVPRAEQFGGNAMMGLPVPKDVTERLDKMEQNMADLVTGINSVIALLEEQNEILRSEQRHA
jgi:hypothetical protein